jgi:hypothetical protein
MAHLRKILLLTLVLPGWALPWAAQGAAPESTATHAALSDLAMAFANAALRAAARHDATLASQSLAPGPGLEGSAAVEILASEITRRLQGAPSGKLQLALPAILQVAGNWTHREGRSMPWPPRSL